MRRGGWLLGLALVAVCAVPGAAAGTGAVTEERAGEGVIDWSRGLVITRGAAAADLRARSPEVARVGAERRATERAQQHLLALATHVSLADGSKVGAIGQKDPEAARRLARAARSALEVDIDYGSDGSVVIHLGLPLEAIRVALAGPESAPAPRDAAVTGVIVHAGGVVKAPALGLELVAGKVRYAPPVVFTRGSGADPRLGDSVLEARALSRDGRALSVDLEPEALARARAGGALVRIVLESPR